MEAPEQNEPQKPRTLFSGILKILSGVDDIQVSLTKWRLWIAAAGIVMATGGIADRTQGFPILEWVAKPLLSESRDDSPLLRRIERKQDSAAVIAVVLSKKVDSLTSQVSGIKDTLSRVNARLGKTQAVVTRLAELTKTDKTIIREREQRRGLFGDFWGSF